MNLICQRCEHDWNYRGNQDYYTNCPKCMVKVRTIPAEFMGEEEEEEDVQSNHKDS